jgi:hypothetical protein
LWIENCIVDLMNVLFAPNGAATYMRPPVMGGQKVNSGHDWADELGAKRRMRSFANPCGRPDPLALAAKLPAEQRPDAALCRFDVSWRKLARNLAEARQSPW